MPTTPGFKPCLLSLHHIQRVPSASCDAERGKLSALHTRGPAPAFPASSSLPATRRQDCEKARRGFLQVLGEQRGCAPRRAGSRVPVRAETDRTGTVTAPPCGRRWVSAASCPRRSDLGG